MAVAAKAVEATKEYFILRGVEDGLESSDCGDDSRRRRGKSHRIYTSASAQSLGAPIIEPGVSPHGMVYMHGQ